SIDSLNSIGRLTLQTVFVQSDFHILSQFFADVHYSLSEKSDGMAFTIPELSDEVVLPISSSTKAHYNLGFQLSLLKVNCFKTSAAYTYSFDKDEAVHTGMLGFHLMF
ncbi:hypothetical protein OAP56_04105, partial [Rickettsiaceae bacterium]|nr:hypothetical protein [Rickettsiaceae bacterium]